jgi:hypothetical protein
MPVKIVANQLPPTKTFRVTNRIGSKKCYKVSLSNGKLPVIAIEQCTICRTFATSNNSFELHFSANRFIYKIINYDKELELKETDRIGREIISK